MLSRRGERAPHGASAKRRTSAHSLVELVQGGRRSWCAHLVAVLQQDLLTLPLHKLNEGDEEHQRRSHIPEVILHELSAYTWEQGLLLAPARAPRRARCVAPHAYLDLVLHLLTHVAEQGAQHVHLEGTELLDAHVTRVLHE